MTLLIRSVQNKQIYRDKKQTSGCLGLGWERGESWIVTMNGQRFISNVMKML